MKRKPHMIELVLGSWDIELQYGIRIMSTFVVKIVQEALHTQIAEEAPYTIVDILVVYKIIKDHVREDGTVDISENLAMLEYFYKLTPRVLVGMSEDILSHIDELGEEETIEWLIELANENLKR